MVARVRDRREVAIHKRFDRISVQFSVFGDGPQPRNHFVFHHKEAQFVEHIQNPRRVPDLSSYIYGDSLLAVYRSLIPRQAFHPLEMFLPAALAKLMQGEPLLAPKSKAKAVTAAFDRPPEAAPGSCCRV